jgi:hypothetical protein
MFSLSLEEPRRSCLENGEKGNQREIELFGSHICFN